MHYYYFNLIESVKREIKEAVNGGQRSFDHSWHHRPIKAQGPVKIDRVEVSRSDILRKRWCSVSGHEIKELAKLHNRGVHILKILICHAEVGRKGAECFFKLSNYSLTAKDSADNAGLVAPR